MSHIVLVTYNWPPRNAIGTHRPYAWAKYWSRRGHRVTVLTSRKQAFDQPLDLELPRLPGVDVVETDVLAPSMPRLDSGSWERRLSVLKRIKRLLRSRLGVVLDSRDGWIRGAAPYLHDLARSGDFVVSTFGPRASHVIAAKMKAINPGLGWIADYRDLWSQNHLTNYSALARHRESRLEQSTLENASAVTTVSEELAAELGRLLSRHVDVVPNGFDQDEVAAVAGPGSVGRPKRIVYTGLLYPGTRDPAPLLAALRELRNEGRALEGEVIVEFFGPETDWLQTLIDGADLRDIVFVRGRVDRPTAVAHQRAADRLLLLESPAPGANGVVTGKLFEYMAAGQPILSVGSGAESAIGRVLRQCGIGTCVGEDVRSAKAEVLAMLKDEVPAWFQPRPEEILKYTRERQADRMLELMAEVKRDA